MVEFMDEVQSGAEWGAICKLKTAGCRRRMLVPKMSVPHLPAVTITH